MRRWTSIFLAISVLLMIISTAVGGNPGTGLWKRENLSGDWGGLRSRLSAKGITLQGVYTAEEFGNLSGGLHRKAVYLDNLDLILHLNGQKLFGAKGMSFLLYGLANHGGNPDNLVGDAQGISNIQAYNTWKLYEAWIQQNLWGDRFSLLAGLYDLNSEFDVLQPALLFINSSHGIDPTFSQSGLNGPSIFPYTTAGVRLRITPLPELCFQTALMNGLSGDPNHPGGTHILFGKKYGLLSTTEIAWLFWEELPAYPGARKDAGRLSREKVKQYAGKIGIGFWAYSAAFPRILQPPGISKPANAAGDHGAYLLLSCVVHREAGDPEQKLSLFARIGLANPVMNRFGSYIGGGLTYHGLLPERSQDEAGIALALARNGHDYSTLQKQDRVPSAGSEINIEATYLAQLSPWLTLQPDIQYIIHPNTDPGIKNALAVDLRFTVSL